MKSMTRFLPLVLAALLAPGVVHADDPKFDFAKKEETKTVVWKASANLGAYGSTGNAQTLTINGGINVSRNDGWNKVTLDAAGAYSQAWTRGDTVTVAAPAQIQPADLGAINNRVSKTAAANWLAKLRYDRFFTKNDTLYVAGFAGQDFVVNKDIIGGGQLGYSRLLLTSEVHNLAVEAGYDFTYTRFAAANGSPAPSPDFTTVHALRLFAGYVLTLRKETAINASAEAFINVTNVDTPGKFTLDGVTLDPNSHKTFGQATRLVGKVGLTTLIYKNISFKFQLTGKYDAAPSPIAFKTVGMLSAAAGAQPLLRYDTFDFIAEAGIVVTFL